jgi:hypothetical protein
MPDREQELHLALAELVMAFSQQKQGPWSSEDIAMVQRAQALLAAHPEFREEERHHHPWMHRPWNE